MFARGGAAPEVSDRALLQAMLDVEAAHAAALADAGLIPAKAAGQIAAACDAATFDIASIGRSTADTATPVPELVRALRTRVGADAEPHVHRGLTSQDVVDTALMLVARRALTAVLADLEGAAGACARLADEHRDTAIAGRTLLQQAMPLTFGMKAAIWLTGLDSARADLLDVRDRTLAAQVGGAVGTLAAFGDSGAEVAAAVAERLGLVHPPLPWHAVRLRPARLACTLAAALGVMGKVARDVVLLAQTEVAEVAEPAGEGRGASSAMPHKRNPVGAVAVLACAQRAPGLAATILSSMVQEHERAAGAWQAEWEPLIELLRLTGSAAAALSELLSGLRVDAGRMRHNLGAAELHPGASGALIDRALVAHRELAIAPAPRRPA